MSLRKPAIANKSTQISFFAVCRVVSYGWTFYMHVILDTVGEVHLYEKSPPPPPTAHPDEDKRHMIVKQG